MSTQADNDTDINPRQRTNFSCQYCHKTIGPNEIPYTLILPSGTEQRWHVACDAQQSTKVKKNRR